MFWSTLIASVLLLVLLRWHFLQLRHEMNKKNLEIAGLKQRGAEFVANVSHELKTPLTSIMGYTETLKSVILKDDPQKAIEFLNRIEQNADRLSVLINELLDLSRIESPNVHLEKEIFLLKELLVEVQSEFSLKLSKKNQVLVIRGNEIQLFGDRRLVAQALSNLLENANRYCQDGALIEVEASEIYRDGRNWIQIFVSDNGPGISSADLPRIFERFYRAEKSRTRLTGGTGLGLAIVKHIALSHGGQALVESELQKGTKFTLLFPPSDLN